MIYIVLFVIFLVIVWFLFTYNKFIRLNNSVSEAFSTMDVYLKKRWDLIPGLVETVKGYAKHEERTFEEVTKLRSEVYDAMNDSTKLETNEKLSQGIVKVMALAEAYPELKASDSFRDLSNRLTNIENDIANSRKYYNAVVKQFNNLVQMFPSSLIAGIFGYSVKLMFQASDGERENVKINL